MNSGSENNGTNRGWANSDFHNSHVKPMMNTWAPKEDKTDNIKYFLGFETEFDIPLQE